MRRGLDILKLLHQCWIDLRLAAKLAVMPWRLRAISERMSPSMMVAAGVICGWFSFAVTFGVVINAVWEPWGTLSVYFDDLRSTMPSVLLLAAVPAALMLLGALIVLPLPQRGRPMVGVLVLWPVPMVLPALVWSLAFAVRVADQDVFDPNTPAWIEWPVWSFFGACHWPAVLLFGMWVYVGLEVRRILTGGTMNAGACAHCGYDLVGIASARCPECGEPRDDER